VLSCTLSASTSNGGILGTDEVIASAGRPKTRADWPEDTDRRTRGPRQRTRGSPPKDGYIAFLSEGADRIKRYKNATRKRANETRRSSTALSRPASLRGRANPAHRGGNDLKQPVGGLRHRKIWRERARLDDSIARKGGKAAAGRVNVSGWTDLSNRTLPLPVALLSDTGGVLKTAPTALCRRRRTKGGRYEYERPVKARQRAHDRLA